MSRLPLPWVLLAVSLVVGLAALVRIVDPTVGAGDDLTGVIRLPSPVTWTIAALFAGAALLVVLDVVRRMRSRRHAEDEELMGAREAPPRQPWLQAVTQLFAFLNFVVLAYLLWTNTPLMELLSMGHGAMGAPGAPAEPAPDAPALITWTFAAVALLAGAAALGFAVWLTTGDRLATWWAEEPEEPAPPPLVRAVEESLEDLRAEPDARRAIIRCYARFEHAAAASGLERRPWHTPMEFMREALARLPAPGDAVRALTGLFELARFSDRALGPGERARALDALDDIKGAIDGGR
jgi:hypothetical protein